MEYKIQVTVNSEDKTITIEDNGIGMTAEEVEEYINQIAFSGAQDFLAKYKDKANEDQIIGHFGLGFYSAFMVADKVTIDTLSYKKDAEPVHWESEGGTEFSMDKGDKEGNGTKIVLYLNEDSTEFCNEYRAREVIQKYCSFMPVEIYLKNATAEPEYETIEKDACSTAGECHSVPPDVSGSYISRFSEIPPRSLSCRPLSPFPRSLLPRPPSQRWCPCRSADPSRSSHTPVLPLHFSDKSQPA